MRALIADDESDMTASGPAFAALRFIASRRLKRGRLTVIDATNVRLAERRPLLELARRYQRPAVAVLFDLPLSLCLEWNAARPGRQIPEDVVQAQWELLPTAKALAGEGFDPVHVITS
jgi:predicted kinase